MATLEGHVLKVEQAGDWFRINIDHEKVKRLDTKIESKAKEAFKLMKSGDLAVIEYTHKPRTDEATGRTYHNYYYEKALAKANGGGDDDIPSVEPVRSKTAPDDAWRMALSTGAKIASEVAAGQDFSVQAAVAQQWARFIFFTQKPSSGTSGFSESSSGVAGLPAEADTSFAFTDDGDDIPF